MSTQIPRHDVATPDLVEKWFPEGASFFQQAIARKIIAAQAATMAFNKAEGTREESKRVCHIALDCIQDIPEKFFRDTFFGETRSTVKAKLRLVKTNLQKLIDLLASADGDYHKENRLKVSICGKIDFVVERLLYYSYACKE